MGTLTTPEIAHDDAVRVLRAEYYGDVKSVAEDLRDRIKLGEIADYEGLDEAVWEDCDGSQWVIYTGKSWQLLFVSDNHDAYFGEGLGDGAELVSADGLRVEALAFHAMRRDIWEALEVLGIDHTYDFDGTDEAEESEEAAHVA